MVEAASGGGGGTSGPSSDAIRLAAAARRERADAAVDTLRDPQAQAGGAPGGRARSEKALRLEATAKVRAELEAEQRRQLEEAAARAEGAQAALVSRAGVTLPPRDAAAYAARFGHLETERARALRDPRVQAELGKVLNAPNNHMYTHNLTRNTTRVSAERRY